MASLLLAAGEPGERACLPNARIMVHQPIGGAQVGGHSWQTPSIYYNLLVIQQYPSTTDETECAKHVVDMFNVFPASVMQLWHCLKV
jgi:hypothetical protein